MHDEKEQLRQKLFAAVADGYGGMMRGTGMLVDRREHPEAMPIQKNTMLGCPEPKKVERCTT